MARYIDKDALIAEIRKYKNNAEAYLKYHHNRNDKLVHSFEQEKLVMSELLSFLDTLEAKEVDLEKELESWRHNHFHGRRDKEASGEYLERVSQLNIAKHFFELGLNIQKEPVSEPNKELAKTYLDVFDKKFPILPTLKGKELADYKNFLNRCQQIFGLKYWGVHPVQAKLFEKLSLLWVAWGAEHLHGLGKYNKEEQDTIVSEDLEKAAIEAFKQIVDTDKNNFLEIFKAGAKWKEKQVIKDAIDATVFCESLKIPTIGHFLHKTNLKENDKVKVIIIKSE